MRSDQGYFLRLYKSQIHLFIAAVGCLTAGGTESALGVRTGSGKDGLERLGKLFADGEEHALSVEDLHTLHAVLLAACNLFSSEEAFYNIVGFFRENALAFAEALVKAAEAAAVER